VKGWWVESSLQGTYIGCSKRGRTWGSTS